MLYSRIGTKQKKQLIMERKQYEAQVRQSARDVRFEKRFILSIKEDLWMLKEESFQRHEPEYYDEVEYYSNFHKLIPDSLVLTDSYKRFTKVYAEEGGSLRDAVLAFLEAYESDKSEREDA